MPRNLTMDESLGDATDCTIALISCAADIARL